MAFVKSILDLIFNTNSWYGAIFFGLLFVVASSVIARGVRLGAQRAMNSGDLVDPTVVMFLTQLAQIIVYLLALIIFFHIIPALNKLGTALLTGVSVMSVVFGLAAQNTLGNLVAGCTLLLYRPFHLDDLVQVATPTGTEIGIVERLTLGYTMLRTLDDRLVIVPNSLMASQVTLNLNRGKIHSMVIIPVGVDVAHADEVRRTLLESAHKQPKIHHVISCVSKPFDSGLTSLQLRAWCDNLSAATEIKAAVTHELVKKFENTAARLLIQDVE